MSGVALLGVASLLALSMRSNRAPDLLVTGGIDALEETPSPAPPTTAPFVSTTTAPVDDERPLVVEPSVALHNGQELHVEIRRPSSLVLVDICTAGDDDLGCSFFPATTRSSAVLTEHATRFVVTRSGKIVDCAERRGRCVFKVYGVGEVPLEFDATQPSPEFAFAATSTTGLDNRDSIRLYGTTPTRSITVAQCLAAMTADAQCVPLTSITPTDGGAFDAKVGVARTLSGRDHDHDCASEPCELRLSANLFNGAPLAKFTLDFSTSEPFAPASVQLQPGLIRDGGEVTVRGANLIAGAFVSVQVCGTSSDASPARSAALCERRMYTGTVDGGGSLSITVTLRKRTTGFLPNAGVDPELDCVASPCTVNVNINNGRGYSFPFQFGDDGVASVGGGATAFR